MACSKGLSTERLKEDRISQLPDALLSQILNHLPTIEEAVKTSVLSTRWRTLWLLVPRLKLDFKKFPSFNAFLSFGNWFFDSDRVTCIEKLRLYIDDNDASSYLTSWIGASVKRKVQRLLVDHVTRDAYSHSHEMPLSLYVCESLVCLRLYRLTLVAPELVSLPCLKILRLSDIVFTNETTFERLVSSCPVLEYLKVDVVWNDENVCRVHSRSLKWLRLTRRPSPLRNLRIEYCDPGVEIDAPLLCSLRIHDTISESYTFSDLESNDKFDLSILCGTGQAKTKVVQKCLTLISRIRDLTICSQTFAVMINRYSKYSPLPLPQFSNMSSLYITLNAPDIEAFLIFLRSCPNLKSLILVKGRVGCYDRLCPKREMKRLSISPVPECLLSSLEFVEFKSPIFGLSPEIKLVWYLLENSATLKKLTLCLNSSSTKDDLVKIPRVSTECEVIFL
ncbi:PREDICTED: LOW QUALITY PROTEIN: putative F-box/FBD/LRR-repeat protein At2g05300 [Camelina sativa]|uniref:LOW QUALITY PROTEIN: putative F-box/FBD/LRR-repeat protein At2g05300 n=1 Tax=Camelina sativa TaxID=90675 RepID=A0ABM1RBR5_CAMSA|nr:PREDICTED: LOW QUALITY PROTEIN: putative F-box/FBD/LRR-repeat protein At2g05300 [Camelina sativa]